MLVRLIVTGDLEKKALGGSLERVLRGAGAEVTFQPRLVAGAAMTSNPLGDPEGSAPTPTPVRRMANALVTETLDPRTPQGDLPDLVVGIDDLELANRDRPLVVLGWVRRAVEEVLVQRYSSLETRERARRSLRARCSFHLLVPLVEAYFFGERAALRRAGVAEATPVHRRGADVECFVTDDPAFMPGVAKSNAQKASFGEAWWDEARHPKRYLEFLIAQERGELYREVMGGAEALTTLDWSGVVCGGGAYARSLFEDLADALSLPNPLGAGLTSPDTYPSKSVRRESLTLRNV